MNASLVAQLLEPIPGDDIGGTDVAFDPIVDEIREARRQDDPTLSQGDWETEVKIAQWPRVRELAEKVLREQSKDLQVAAWYAEAMTRVQGFGGLAVGLAVFEGLINDFWEFCYPSLDPEDLDERASRIEWINRQLPAAIRELALTDRSSGGYSWLRWEESRVVENFGLKDPAAREKAIANGKLSGDAFDKAVQLSGRGYYESLYERIETARVLAQSLEKRVDERFGQDAPSLRDLRQALQACSELVVKLLARFGVVAAGSAPTKDKPVPGAAQVETVAATAASAAVASQPIAVGQIATRNDAINALREAARYFRRNEPHSPVAPLAERAAKWAEMPLEQWLASVIKDEGTLGQLRELLDLRDSNDQ
jgi:type VI secretion system protein ImpA